uniref:GNAT family N-acetyltransferase n=1 Tax=Phenylobacterium glaciei TaxID=2803784 RepID=A0A974P0P7_9CAUL|nr:GNAT family N-acetyltransferase [Phenylobacterium glaciei]
MSSSWRGADHDRHPRHLAPRRAERPADRGGHQRRLGELHAPHQPRDGRRLLGPRPGRRGADERVILGAFDGEALVGTVTLLLDCPDNQPHRAEIAKMITRLSHRGRGIATALLREAERLAVERSRTLLVLDTATDGGAARSTNGSATPSPASS